MASAKSVLKMFAHRFGFDIVRYVEEFDRPFDVLKLAVRERLARGDGFFFVQIGACDGIRADPLRDLILEHRLEGLLVEPLPDQFEKLQQNYSDQPQLRFENCAVADHNGSKPLYRVQEGAPVPEWAVILASFDKQHLIKHNVKNLDKHIEEIDVPTLTLSTLLEKHRIDDVTLLQVDTEGYDYEILKMAMKTGLHPAIINYEHAHLIPPARVECKRMLADNGYEFLDVGIDTLAVRAA